MVRVGLCLAGGLLVLDAVRLCAAEPRKTSLVELLRILENNSVMGAETLGAESHFVDLGAGFGKVVFGAALMTNTPRATGIELSE